MSIQIDKGMTSEQFSRIAARGELGRCELIEGRLAPLSGAKPRHGRIAGRIFGYVYRHVEKRRLGVTYAAETGYWISRDPDTVRCPDVSFVRADRVARHNEDDYFEAPDLAVEVLSPSDPPAEVRANVESWLAAGACSVWVVDPDAETVTIHRADGPTALVRADEALRDEAVLPGFDVTPMRKNFRR